MAKTSYAIALGSNRPSRHGSPAETLRAAVAAIEEQGFEVKALSTIRATPALGPAGRAFANAAAIVAASLEPPELLDQLKATETWFGRRSGRRWGPRVLDLDIILWSEGPWEGSGLTIPHPCFRERSFVLDPLAEIAPEWRDPITATTVRQLRTRLAARRPVDRAPTPS
ncbi:MAG TPA: 2-amino-4-hydroxy-6-hydroxymethyldihydropteridine diphosphokinase [Allosphingosinicella sp.]|nr:2-amino-4-hydroxy-6-hydroxymethyldihydropteridine diphosphokinase [Allosphingosinicella sp.]